jgi:hypothetical protein
MEQLERRTGACLNGRRFRRSKINARAAGDMVVLVVKANASLSFHQVNELMLFEWIGFELLTGCKPAQRSENVLCAG